MPGVTPEEIHQEVVEQLNEGISLDPQYIQKFFVSNILSRIMAYLFGWDYIANRPVKLQCSSDGLLKVQATAGVNEHNITFSGNAPDTYGTPLDFGRIVRTVDVAISNYDAVMCRSLDNVVYDDEFTVFKDMIYSFDCNTRYIKIKNRTAGSVAVYQIVGWY
jgi:hypothetical protein